MEVAWLMTGCFYVSVSKHKSSYPNENTWKKKKKKKKTLLLLWYVNIILLVCLCWGGGGYVVATVFQSYNGGQLT